MKPKIENQTQITLDSIADSVFTVDLDWKVTSFNKAAEKITGIKKEDAIGRHWWEIFRANICEQLCSLRQTMDTGTPLKALNEWGKAEGELLFAKRAPAPRYEIWKKQGVVPRNIDREIVEIMHRTHIGVDQDYKNLMKQGTRAAIADGWGGSMLATDLQDILFGTPYPLASEANLGVMKEDRVNIIIHGHEPVLSEMIVAVAQTKEMQEYAESKGGQRHPAVRNLLHGQ
jgi:PAS domain S-box-containing protein